MQTPSDDEISRFFDALTPEDFLTESTTNPEPELRQVDEDFPRHGSDFFEQFVLRHLSETDRDGPSHFAVLHNGTSYRTFTMEDETLSDFMLRVAIQSLKFGAQWLFMAVPGEASMGGMFDANDPASIQRARDAGMMLNVTNWYAESVEPSSTEMRYGIVMDNDGERQIIESTMPSGVNPAFKRVMHMRS